jgi:hypothetical protein
MIFMALLLIAFLVPQSIQGFSGREGQFKIKLGQAFGRELTTNDLQEATTDRQVLARANSRSTSDDLDFYLLLQEAKNVGVRVGRDEVKGQFAHSERGEQMLHELQRSSHLGYDQLYDVFGRQLAVNRLAIFQSAGLVDSLPRQEAAYRDRAQQGVADVAVLDDKGFLHAISDPTAEELQVFFEECKGRRTAHSEEQLQFGYLLSDRVRLEYLTVDPAKIKSKVTVQASQMKHYFEENAQKYTKPDPTASQPAAGGQPPQVPMTFEEAKERVREDYREYRAFELAQGLVNEMYTEAHRPWSGAVRDSDGFNVPPAGEPVSFEELKQRFSAKFDVEYGRTELVTADQIGAMPGLTSASLSLGRDSMRLFELAYRVKGILAKDPNDGKPVLNPMEPAPVLMSTKFDRQLRKALPVQAFLVRVAEVAPSAPPASVDEVREKAVADWKQVRAHELAGQYAEKLATQARQVGLKAAVEQATELKDLLTAAEQAASQPAAENSTAPPPPATKYVENLPPFSAEFTRQAGVLVRVGRVPEVVKALFAASDAASGDGSAKRIVQRPVANQNKWVVAELTQIKPLYRESFDAQLAQSLKDGQKRERQRFITDWLSPANIKERARFESALTEARRPSEP